MDNNSSRRSIVTVGPFAINQLHYTNPWVIACWSFFFPGFGQIMLGEYFQGYILWAWEVFVNTKSHFNTAILYSFTGRFEQAKQITDMKWMVLYSAIFVFAFWSSYQLSVQTNNMYYLANRESAPIKVFEMNAFQYDFVDKRKPHIAFLWSLLMPGLGELYNRRLPSAVFVLGWWIVICYMSHVIQAAHFCFYGDFNRATSILNPEWTLYLPSIYAFTAFNSYVTTVDRNTIFDKELSSFLTSHYQSPNFSFNLRR